MFNGGGLPFHDFWNVETLPRHSLDFPASSTFKDVRRPVVTSLPVPRDPQRLPYHVTTSRPILLPAGSDSRLASPKPWYNQVVIVIIDCELLTRKVVVMISLVLWSIQRRFSMQPNLFTAKHPAFSTDHLADITKHDLSSQPLMLLLAVFLYDPLT